METIMQKLNKTKTNGKFYLQKYNNLKRKTIFMSNN